MTHADATTIAVIPARGGSKRLPRKNVMPFGGKPMIAWTIEAARQAQNLARVIVSTDDAEIADVARAHGAEVPFLRDRAADDWSTVSEATLATLHQLSNRDHEPQATTVVQLMPNCPLRIASDIDRALENFRRQRCKFQISAVQMGWMNPWWAATLDQNGLPRPLFPEAMTQRSQDLPHLYTPTGAIWIADIAALQQAGTFYGPEHVYFPLPLRSAIDIDDIDDLAFAEAARTAWPKA